MTTDNEAKGCCLGCVSSCLFFIFTFSMIVLCACLCPSVM